MTCDGIYAIIALYLYNGDDVTYAIFTNTFAPHLINTYYYARGGCRNKRKGGSIMTKGGPRKFFATHQAYARSRYRAKFTIHKLTPLSGSGFNSKIACKIRAKQT